MTGGAPRRRVRGGAAFGAVRGGAALVFAATIWHAAPAAAGRLADIEHRGVLVCGVYPGVAGFASVDARGNYSGFDIDICRAVAAAIFGRPDKVRFIVTADLGALTRSPEIDMVARRLTWTLSREAPASETPPGFMFGPITFFDGQTFLAPKSLGLTSVSSLAGRKVCVEDGEGWAGNLARFSRANGLGLQLVVAASRSDGEKRLFSGQCEAWSADESMLGAIRADAPRPEDYAILPWQFTKEPLAPLLRQGDDQFFQIVRWTVFALIDAEELGITAANADRMRSGGDPDQRRLLGAEPGIGRPLGLGDDWAFNVIRAVGNYGEIFARDIGSGNRIKLDRGLNALWTRGGLMYAPPVR